jgi:hypothetical protein
VRFICDSRRKLELKDENNAKQTRLCTVRAISGFGKVTAGDEIKTMKRARTKERTRVIAGKDRE